MSTTVEGKKRGPGRPPGTPNPNAGRKPKYEERMEVHAIRLPENLADLARTLGEGNVSAGVRMALEAMMEKGE